MRATYVVGTGLVGVLLAAAGAGAAAQDAAVAEAVKRADAATVRALVQRGADVNAPEADGTTALHWAARKDDLETATLLIKAGANVRVTNRYGVTPLSLACTNGSAAMIEALLEAGADPNAALPEGETPLLTASRTGNAAAVKVLLAHGADANTAEHYRGQTPLMWAAAEDHVDVAKALIERGADVNAASYAGYTPLMFAARTGDIALVETLLASGANVNDEQSEGASVLDMAITNNHFELAALLLDKGANPNAENAGWTPLHLTIMIRHPEREAVPDPFTTGKLDSVDLVKALLAHGANPNARMTARLRGFGKNEGHLDQIGATPFLIAAQCADPLVMRLLLAAGADPLVNTKSNATAVMAAAGTGYSQGKSPGSEADALEAVKMATELGNDVNAVDTGGYTAMHGAAMRGANSIVQYLFDKGARLDVVNEKGQIPLTLAAEGDGSNSNVRAKPETAALLRKLMNAGRSTASAESAKAGPAK